MNRTALGELCEPRVEHGILLVVPKGWIVVAQASRLCVPKCTSETLVLRLSGYAVSALNHTLRLQYLQCRPDRLDRLIQVGLAVCCGQPAPQARQVHAV